MSADKVEIIEKDKPNKESKELVEQNKEQHTSRCLACKQNYTYPIDFKGEVETSNKAKRFMIFGTCPKGHKIRTFVKKSSSTVVMTSNPIEQPSSLDQQ